MPPVSKGKRARRAAVPPAERALLAALSGPALSERLRGLFEAGWSLSSLAEALPTPRPRTTVRSWITSRPRPPLASPPLKRALPLPPVPSPFSAPAEPDARPVRRFSAPRRGRRLGLDPATCSEISTLAPLARRHRSRTGPLSPARIANESLTRLTRDLYGRGASIPELAEAAGVTYRAMRRRVRGG
jgi:hypothetical protein